MLILERCTMVSSPLINSLPYTCTSAAKGSELNLLRGRVRGIGFKYHQSCKPLHTARTHQQTVTVDAAMQDGVYHAGVVRQTNTTSPTGYQRSFNQLQGIKLESTAQEEGQMGSAVNAARVQQMRIWGRGGNDAGKGGTIAVTSALNKADKKKCSCRERS